MDSELLVLIAMSITQYSILSPSTKKGEHHFDISYFAFEQLAHPVYGAMMLEYRCGLDSDKILLCPFQHSCRPMALFPMNLFCSQPFSSLGPCVLFHAVIRLCLPIPC